MVLMAGSLRWLAQLLRDLGCWGSPGGRQTYQSRSSLLHVLMLELQCEPTKIVAHSPQAPRIGIIGQEQFAV